tara:strand:- start:1586 stop:1870 length:285 start_codon:yes stop_codon:yes gene_type:complete
MLDRVEKIVEYVLTKHKIRCTKLLAIDSLLWLGFGLIYLFYLIKSLYSDESSTDEDSKKDDLTPMLNPIKIVAGVSLFSVILIVCLYYWRFVMA